MFMKKCALCICVNHTAEESLDVFVCSAAMGETCHGSNGFRPVSGRSQGKHVRQAPGKVKLECHTTVHVPRDTWSCYTCGISGMVANEFQQPLFCLKVHVIFYRRME